MVQTSLRARMLEAFRFRMYFFMSAAAVLFLVLVIQLVNLQVVQGSEYRVKSRLNMENYIPISASRGDIYDRNFSKDRNNVVIVSNRPSFNLTTIPAKFESRRDILEIVILLSRITDINTAAVMDEIKNNVNPWERVTLKEDVDFQTIVRVASHPNLFPNVDWEDAPVRVYNFGEMFAHVIGYIGSISREEYRELKQIGYRHYQKIGKAGIEKEYDRLLRGKDGFVRRIVDVKQRTEGEEIGLRPVAGNNIVTTLDYDIQRTAYEGLEEKMGAVIVLKPATGEVLALASKPDFDPNLIISKNNTEVIRELSTNEDRPFLNRAIQSKYPPASTFKLVTAIAALETEMTTPDKTYYCPGKWTLKGYRDHDFYCYRAHGLLDLYGAIAESCSVYFYQLGHKIGSNNILKYADYFGLNEKSNIDIPGEVSGFIPSKKWKLKTFGQPWFGGDTINLSIGQGFLSVTPVGMANFLCGLVNNGIVYKPSLVKEIRTNDNNKVISRFKKEKLREIPLSPTTILTVKRGMRKSVTEGTSARLSYIRVPIAGKTGTAQTRSRREEKYSQHGWFIGYAPFDGPVEKTVAVVVFVEFGIAGAATAVPIAERIYQKMIELDYFDIPEAGRPVYTKAAGLNE